MSQVPSDSLKASWLIHQGATKAFLKRAFDIVGAVVLLIMAMPLMLLTAIAVGLDSPGPLFHRLERVGLRGRLFSCLQFRSAHLEAERGSVARCASNRRAARITRVGALIRRARIDELPQLFSVLRGDMSLVGPRPESPSSVEHLRNEIPHYDVRHAVKPGLTGWTQVRHGHGTSLEDARRRHQLDLHYVKNNSLVVDLLVLIETVSVVLSREGR